MFFEHPWVSGGWDASVLSLYLSSSRQKSFQNLTFSKLAIFSTTVITQIIDINALISYGNWIKLILSKITWSQKCLLICQFWLDLNVPRCMSETAVVMPSIALPMPTGHRWCNTAVVVILHSIRHGDFKCLRCERPRVFRRREHHTIQY